MVKKNVKNTKTSSKKSQVSEASEENDEKKSQTNATTNVVNNENKNQSEPAPIYRYNNIKFDNVIVSDLNKEGSQPLAYINYRDSTRGDATVKILVQSGKLKLVSHGIPPLDSERGDGKTYYPTDEKREFIKIPLDPEQDTCVALRKFLEKVDLFFGSDDMKKKLFGKKANMYQYQSTIRTPQTNNNNDNDDDDDDDDSKSSKKKGKKNNGKKEYPIYDFCKMKFNVIKQGEGRVNKTKLKKVDAGIKTQIKADTITEIAKEIRYLSEIKFIFYFNKVWANAAKAPGASFILYGVGFKVMAIEYTPSPNKGLNTDDIDFLSEEDEEEEIVSPSKKSPKKNSKNLEENNEDEKKDSKNNKKNPKFDDEEDVDEQNNQDDNDDDQEEEISVKKSKKNKKNDESEDEENQLNEDDENNDNDDDEISIKKSSKKTPNKKTNKKNKKSKDKDSEDEEDEDIQPKKKSNKKTKTSSKSR